MKAVDVKLVSRPIKIGYCILANDELQVKKAMQTASAYWGGFQHCLIPIFCGSENVKSWQRKHARRVSGSTITDEFLTSYAPDYLSYPKRMLRKQDYGIDEIPYGKLVVGNPYPSTEYGIQIVEALNEQSEKLYDAGGENDPIPLVVSDGSSPVLDAFLLRQRTGFHNALKRDCAKTGLYAVKEVNANNFLDVYNEEDPMGFIAISRSNLTNYRTKHEKITYLLCDSMNPLDAFHLWNMRAAGYRVFPIFLDQMKTDKDVEMAHSFMANSSPNKSVSWSELPQFFVSERLRKRKVDWFIEVLKKKREKHDHDLVTATWGFPRYWYTKERTERRGSILKFSYDEVDKEIFTTGDYIKIPFAKPSCSSSSSSEPCFKVECSLRIHSDSGNAGVFPETRVQGYPSVHYRDNKAVIMARSYDEWEFLPLISPHLLVKSVLKDKRVGCEISQPGKYLTKMVKSIGGIQMASPLMIKGMLGFLYTVDNTHSQRVSGGIKELLNKASEWGWRDAKRVLKILVSNKILKMLVQLKCPHCNKRFEVDFASLKEEMQCATCFEKFDDHSSDPDNMTFVYSRAGVFSLPRKAYGVPVVFLTMAFFGKLGLGLNSLNHGTSYNIKIEGLEGEVDLVTFVSSGAWYDQRVRPIFAECKFNFDFEENDVDLLCRLGTKFDDALLVCSTMKCELSAREQIILRKLARKLRRDFKARGKGSNLLVLTSNELERIGSDWNLWGEGHQNFLDSERQLLGYFDADCFVSQKKYLGLELDEMRCLQEPVPVSYII